MSAGSRHTHRGVLVRSALGLAVCLALAAAAGPSLADPQEREPAITGVLSLDHPPTPDQVDALRALGLRTQGLAHLPMALVRGTPQQVHRALAEPGVRRFDPDQPLEPLAASSNESMGASSVHVAGVTGKGVQVAVIDSGIDATHPDLVGRVSHNVKVIGPEYARQDAGTAEPLVLVADEGPYSNTDVTGGGHGTLVSGMVAATGAGSPEHRGAAPGAELIGYAIGEASVMLTILASYDHLLSHPEWGVDIVNNSWGIPIWSPYDPMHPVVQAQRAMHRAGMVVVQGYGNWGRGRMPMSASPMAMSPWVIGVAATTNHGERALWSSIGLPHDNSNYSGLTDGRARYVGDRLGVHSPTVAAPGQNLAGPCATGVAQVVWQCRPAGGTVQSGTSLSAPNVSGVLALIEQVRPGLSPDRLRDVLVATARPVDGEDLSTVGYGTVDAAAAVALARRPDFPTALRKAVAAAQARVLAQREWRVRESTHWSWRTPVLAAGPAPDLREERITVPRGVDALWVGLAHPAWNSVGSNPYDYAVAVRDAGGNEIASAASDGSYGVAHVLVDLRGRRYVPGAWTLSVTGSLLVSDDPAQTAVGFEPEHRRATLIATQLRAR